jgi:hypothetical protein
MEDSYDVGSQPDSSHCNIHRYLGNLSSSSYDWWIGLSLGAAVAHICSVSIIPELRPKRLTLINTFGDRKKLAETKGFSIDNQWPLVPQNFPFDSDIQIDVVVSLQDTHIPPSMGLQMENYVQNPNVNFIALNSDHNISSSSKQKDLAFRLYQDKSVGNKFG